jgi:hypothetical protein
LLPKWFIERFYGKYQWTADSCKTYREHFKELPS